MRWFSGCGQVLRVLTRSNPASDKTSREWRPSGTQFRNQVTTPSVCSSWFLSGGTARKGDGRSLFSGPISQAIAKETRVSRTEACTSSGIRQSGFSLAASPHGRKAERGSVLRRDAASGACYRARAGAREVSMRFRGRAMEFSPTALMRRHTSSSALEAPHGNRPTPGGGRLTRLKPLTTMKPSAPSRTSGAASRPSVNREVEIIAAGW